MPIRSLALAVCLLPLFSFSLEAAPRCPLDVSNPAITRTVIPLHTPIQGVTSYATPSEWKYFTFQEHKSQFNAMVAAGAVVDEAGILLLRDDLGHLHGLELCYPYGGEWPAGMRQMTLPVRARLFHTTGRLSGIFGEMVRPVVWDAGSVFSGNPMGVTVATGVLTYDVALATWGGAGNIQRPALNGWTNFHACGDGRGTDGAALNNCGTTSMYTRFDPNATEPNMDPAVGASGTALFPQDPGGNIWGSLIIDGANALPLLPFDTVWIMPGLTARTYAGDGILMASKKQEMRIDMDLHAGILGRHLTSPFGVLDPAEIGVGPHTLTFIAQTSTGPTGIPGVAAPNEVITVLLGTDIEVGPTVTPPPGPQDCVVGAWLTTGATITATDALTVGLVQTRTRTTVEAQQRPILTPPTNGGAGCPLS